MYAYATAPVCIYRLAVLIEHRTVEYISTATIPQASMVWHDAMLHHEQYTGESSAMFVPIINLDPSNPSCNYTTTHFVSSQSKQFDATFTLTFDKPLHWRALNNVLPCSQPALICNVWFSVSHGFTCK